MSYKKRGIYVVTKNMESDKISDPGVYKKIYSQLEELNRYFDVNLIEAYYKTSTIRKFLSRLPFFPNLFWTKKGAIDYTSDFIYFRLNFGDLHIIRFFRNIKRNNPRCKIIVELPDYPVNWRKFLKRWHQKPFILKHKFSEYFLHLYVDRIVVFNNYENIYGIKTIVTENGVNIDRVKLRSNISERNTINIISVSTMLDWQGIDRFLIGLGEYYKQKTKVRFIKLYLVGNGQSKCLYEKIIKDYGLEEHVEMCGMLFNENLDNKYNICDIALAELGRHRIQSKQKRSTSIKVREYWAKGLPVICASKFDEKTINEIGDYIHFIPSNEEYVNIEDVISFYDSIYGNEILDKKIEVANKLRKFAESNCSMRITMQPVIRYILEGGAHSVNE